MGQTLSKGMLFRFLLQTLHDKEIVSEEAFGEWAEEHKGETSSPRAELYTSQKVSDFIEWLQEASEDDSDEDSD
jgi:translation initiation factor eIF-2B subunit epsilon